MLIPICFLGLFLFQDPDQADVQERLEVEYVMLDVMAVDKKGRPVTDLKASDFVVKENRKKVEVTFFGSLDLRTGNDLAFTPVDHIDTEKQVETKEKPARQVQQIILALDLESIGMAHARRTFTQLREYITTLDTSFDYQIYVHSLEYGAISKGFVSQRERVLEALSNMQDQHFSHRTDRGRKARREGGLLESMQSDDSGPYSSTSRGSFLNKNPLNLADLEKAFRTCDHLFEDEREKLNCMSDALRDFFEQHYNRTSRVLGELTSLTYKFNKDKNLKTMVLVSPGFIITNLDSAIQLQREVLGVYKDTFMNNETNQFFDKESNKSFYRKLLHACVQNRVIYHVLDIFNGMDQDMRNGPQFARNSAGIRNIYQNYNMEVSHGLQHLADGTGGTFNQSFHLGAPIKKVIEGGRFYFQLGYASLPGKKDKWRKIKVKCKRKGVKLSYRKGYFGN